MSFVLRKLAYSLLMATALVASLAAAQAQGYPAPPPVPYEMAPPPPPGGPRWAWRAGHWQWDGRAYVWVAGRYVHPPRRDAQWIPGHWVPRGPRWVWVDGHWG